MQQTSGGGVLLRNRPFRYLLTGHSVSSLGDWVATFGLMLFVRDLTRGSSIEGLAISGILGFRILPALIAAPIASTITDRFDRRRTMIATDLIRAALIAAVPFTPNLGAVYAIAFVLEGMSLVFLPARDAVVPKMVPSDRLAAANGLIMIAQWGAIPIAGGLVVASDAAARALINAPIIGFLARQRFALPFFFDALTFLISAWAILALPRAVGYVRKAAETSDGALHTIEKDLVKGISYLLEDRGRRDMIIGMALATGAGGALFAIGIPYVKTTLRASDSVFGSLIALWGVGMAIGAYVSQKSTKRESELFRLGLGGSGLILILMAVVAHAWLAVGLSVAFGAGLSIAMVLGITVAQRTAPDEYRGRVMATVHVLARVCLIAGSVIFGGIAALMDRYAASLFGWTGWDGNRYALLIAGAVLVAGGTAARTGASRIEAQEPSEERTSG